MRVFLHTKLYMEVVFFKGYGAVCGEEMWREKLTIKEKKCPILIAGSNNKVG